MGFVKPLGDLFGGGVSDELEPRLEAMDRDYSQPLTAKAASLSLPDPTGGR